MLVLTKDKFIEVAAPTVGTQVGYREHYDTGIHGFQPQDIGTILEVKDENEKKMFVVKFPDDKDEPDTYDEHQLVILL